MSSPFKREPWMCRHGVNLKDVKADKCDPCGLAPDPMVETVLATLAQVVKLQIESLSKVVRDCELPKDTLSQMLNDAQVSLLFASATANALNAPDCQTEFPIRYAIAALHAEAPTAQRSLAVCTRHVREAEKSVAKWAADVKEWAQLRTHTD